MFHEAVIMSSTSQTVQQSKEYVLPPEGIENEKLDQEGARLLHYDHLVIYTSTNTNPTYSYSSWQRSVSMFSDIGGYITRVQESDPHNLLSFAPSDNNLKRYLETTDLSSLTPEDWRVMPDATVQPVCNPQAVGWSGNLIFNNLAGVGPSFIINPQHKG